MPDFLDLSPPPSPTADLLAVYAEAFDLGGDVERLTASADAVMDGLERALAAHIGALPRRVADALRRLGDDPALGRRVDWDAAIAEAERAEDEVRREFASIAKLLDRHIELAERVAPTYARSLRALAGRGRAITDRYAAGLQEIRWALLALRAEAHRSERGPVFDSGADLERHLSGLLD